MITIYFLVDSFDIEENKTKFINKDHFKNLILNTREYLDQQEKICLAGINRQTRKQIKHCRDKYGGELLRFTDKLISLNNKYITFYNVRFGKLNTTRFEIDYFKKINNLIGSDLIQKKLVCEGL